MEEIVVLSKGQFNLKTEPRLLEKDLKKEVLIGVLDLGTTSVRFLIFRLDGSIHSQSFEPIKQVYPRSGWVEEDLEEIWEKTKLAINKAIEKGEVNPRNILAIGITNQRESVAFWEKDSGMPCSNLIVWQDRRTAHKCRQLKEEGYENIVKQKTGLTIDPYFSATKIEWALENNPDIKNLAETGKLAFGTVDSFIIFKLTGKHLTDYSNASRTLLFNISNLCWDDELLEIFNVPKKILPKALPCYGNGIFGKTKLGSPFRSEIPICCVFGDQQAALFGHRCFNKGDIKATFGTGSFIMVNTGKEKIISNNGLLSTIFYDNGRETLYALEGSIYNTGSVFQWLKEGLGIIESYDEIEKLAADISYQKDLFMVPAFTGMGAPFWDPYARGLIIGITRATSKNEIVKAAVDSMGYRTVDVIKAIKKDAEINISQLSIDGGVTRNELFCQVLADLSGIKIKKFDTEEITSMGAMYGAAIGVGVWNGPAEVKDNSSFKQYSPQISKKSREELYSAWGKAVARARNWSKD
ncbi:MAG: glycerol kinase GlpK [Actinomycetota bacterium]